MKCPEKYWTALAGHSSATASANRNKRLKMFLQEQMDRKFGAPWNVVIGEYFSFEITFEARYCTSALTWFALHMDLRVHSTRAAGQAWQRHLDENVYAD